MVMPLRVTSAHGHKLRTEVCVCHQCDESRVFFFILFYYYVVVLNDFMIVCILIWCFNTNICNGLCFVISIFMICDDFDLSTYCLLIC